MKKLLIITPHLSTGGAPQVTVNKIELLKDVFDILVIEHAFLAWNFVVQRNRIIDLVGINNFISLGENKYEEIKRVVDNWKPDIIAMEEFPEMFLDKQSADYLYNPQQPWKIIETTHDSSFDPRHKYYLPDRFVFVSAYNAFKYINLPVPTEIIEYPINKKERNKLEMQNKLGLDPAYKHFAIVGLFTPRKNQAYAFEIAKQLEKYKVKFHFLGNQADNFKDYWEPLMNNKPDNCIVWGERNDVSEFLQACDVFFFPSKGDRGNKELNPIAIKEAMEYPDLTKMMYNLDVYCNKYDGQEDVMYLTGDVSVDLVNIMIRLNLNRLDEELIIIGTYPNLKERVNLTKKTIESMKPLGRKIMLVSHYPVDDETQRMVDYYVYDKNNPLTHHSYYTKFYNDTPNYYAEININGLKDTNQSLTVLVNIFNGIKIAKQNGYKRVFYNTYDVVVDSKDLDVIEKALSSGKNAYVATLPTPMGKGIQTNGMMFDVDYFLRTFDDTSDPQEYNRICEWIGAQNFLEDYLSKRITEDNTEIITNEYETLLVHSGLGTSSNSEYYSIVPVVGKSNRYMFYFFTYNIDHRQFQCYIDNTMFLVNINNNREWMHEFEYTGNNTVRLKFYDGEDCYKTEIFRMNPSTIDKYQHTGRFESKIKERPRIKLVHIQTTLNDEREQASRASLERVKDHGWEYKLHLNHLYRSLPPEHNCIRPFCVSMELFNEQQVQQYGTALTPAHYGCYQAFRDAILSEFHDCDFLMVCEGDCIIETDIHNFIRKVEECAHLLGPNGIEFMSFGDKDTLEHGWPQSPEVRKINDVMYETDHIIGLQSIMFPIHIAPWLKETLRKEPWDAADMYFNIIFNNQKMGIVYERLTTQADGFSLIDNMEKSFRKK
jgi:glycosyltransferase involved in cell wall biosynthesis